MNRRIVITLGRLERGGAELRTLQLLRRLLADDAATQFYLYVVSGQKGGLSPDFERLNIRVIYGKPGFFGLFDFLIHLLKIKPDVVHVNANLAGGLFCFMAWLASVRTRYAHIRTTEDYGVGFVYKLKKPVYVWLINFFSSRVVGVCAGARLLANVPESKWLTIYNGIEDLSHNNSIDASRHVGRLIVMGRFHAAKNQVFAIYVLKELVDTYPDIAWSISFFGKDDAAIRRSIDCVADSLGVSSRVFFEGVSQKPLADIAGYDVLLLPSVREGLPGVVLEAASVGVPSVCSDLPGCTEIGSYLSCVSVVSLTDGPRAWANAVRAVSSNQLLGAGFLDEFRKSPFTFENHVAAIKELWGLHG